MQIDDKAEIPEVMDWLAFKAWLDTQYVKEYAYDIMNKAKEYKGCYL